MKRTYLIILVFCFPLILTAQEYKLVWEENFNGNSLDPEIWNIERNVGIWNTGNNRELQHYKKENVNIGDDGDGNNCLILTAIKENYRDHSFTSGRISTKGKIAFKYGKVEARIKLPDLANGLWPAFWLLGSTNLTWPASGEIDIMEAGHAEGISNNQQNKTFGGALHWEHNDNYAGYGKTALSATPLNSEYHTFTLEWDQFSVNMFLDGEASPYFEMNITGADAEEFRDYPMHILLNMAVGGAFTGIYEAGGITAPLPAKMFVDYVKVYQKENSGEVFYNSPLYGKLGVYTDEVQTDYDLIVGFDAHLSASGVSERNEEIAFEGDDVLSYNLISGQPYRVSITSETINNLSEIEARGSLDFYMKTNSSSDIRIGLKDSTGAESWLVLNESSPYNPDRDGKWSRVIIPYTAFTGLDFSILDGVFMIEGTPEANGYFSVDKIILSDKTLNTDLYGIFTENSAVKEKFVIDNTSSHIYVWENTLNTIENAPPYDGENVLAFKSNTGTTWFGYGLFSDDGIDLSHFSDGYLKLALRTTSSGDFWIGVGGANNTEAKIHFIRDSDPYGFVRDGKWHRISIPISSLVEQGLDLSLCKNVFMLGGAPGIKNILVDDIYYSGTSEDVENMDINPDRDSPLPSSAVIIMADFYGIYSENSSIADHFSIDNVKGHIFIWDRTLRELDGSTPYDGTEHISFKSGSIGWYGFGIFSDDGLNLTHFNNGYLSLAVKTSSSESFWIGMQGDENTEAKITIDENSPYNFERDGKWHRILIPMSELIRQGLDLEKCGNIFMLGGTKISDIAVDDIILTVGETQPANPNLVTSSEIFSSPVEKIHVYPVPVSNILNIKSYYPLTSVEIINSSGFLCRKVNRLNDSFLKVNMQDLLQGVYVARIVLLNGKTVVIKVVKVE